MDPFFEIVCERGTTLHEQVRQQIRELILTGKLPPGAKLPATAELARRLNTHVPTVHLALRKLVQEGLLERYHGKGTFVRQREQKLTCVAVYDTGSVRESQYKQAVHEALKHELTQAAIEMDVWVDSRPLEQCAEPWMPLVKAATNREFQALIVVGGGLPHLRWLRKLPVPAVFQAHEIMPNRVNADMLQFAELSLRALAEQGCRSVGLIMPINPADKPEPGSRCLWVEFVERFIGVAQDLGFTVRNEWMRLWRYDVSVTPPPQDEFGYEEFARLWAQPERPEGLVVFPDTAARGVILGLRDKQVRVPEELKLVLHKNESIDLFCPMPATFAVLSERALARAMIEQAQKQFRGETCEPILLPFRLLAHRAAEQTCGGAHRGNKQQ